MNWGKIKWDEIKLGERHDREIAEDLNVATDTVGKQRRRRGIPAKTPHRPKIQDWECSEMRKLAHDGVKTSDIAFIYGCTGKTVDRYIRGHRKRIDPYRRRVTYDHFLKMCKHRDEGLSLVKIGELCGFSHKTVTRHLYGSQWVNR